MKRSISIDDLYNIELLDDPQISPCGSKIAYVKSMPLEDSYSYQISIIDSLSKEEIDCIKLGNSQNPSWNFDASKIAFLSDESGNKQIYIYDCSNGKIQKLTSMKHGVSEVRFSPRNNKLYFISNAEDRESVEELLLPMSEGEKASRAYEQNDMPWHIKDIVYKFDGIGRLTDNKSHIWELNLEDKKIIRLTNGQHNFRDFSISSDATMITYISDPIDDLDFRPQDRCLWITDLISYEIKLLLNEKIIIAKPTFNKEKTKIVFIGHEAEYGWGTIDRFYVLDVASKKFTCISKDYNNSIGNTAITDLRGGGCERVLYYSYEKEEVYFQTSFHGNNSIYKIDLTGKVQLILGGERNIFSYSMSKDLKKIALCFTASSIPNEIAIYDLEAEEEKVVTTSGKKFLEEVEISPVERIYYKGHDGWNLEGWLMYPKNFDEKKKYPLILEIHGGPQMMYSNSFMLEFQLLAAKDYLVFYCNPRGSTGYGQDFMAGIQRANGGVGYGDYNDLMIGVDQIIKRGYVDEGKLGVTGGSFGGFMTNWIVGHTDRFKAAVTQRSISNWFSFEGVSDYGYCDAQLAHQIDFFEELEETMRISPISYVKNIKTPLLILHSDNDLRCPLEQAQQLFIQLKMLRKTVELVVFPNSSHGLSRNGKPYLRIERLKYLIAWFDKYIFD